MSSETFDSTIFPTSVHFLNQETMEASGEVTATLDGFLFFLIGCNLVIFSSLAIAAFVRSRRAQGSALRKLSWVLAATSAAFALGAAQRMAVYAIRAGWINGDAGDFITREWQLAQSLTASVLGIAAIVVWHRLWRTIHQGETVTRILAEHLPATMTFDASLLTTREQEIVSAIGTGCISDAELADRFFIAPSTARTHVRNIMRKTGIRSRRDLMVLTHTAPSSPKRSWSSRPLPFRLARRERLPRHRSRGKDATLPEA